MIALQDPAFYQIDVTMNLLPGLPLIESPWFSTMKAAMGLSDEEYRIASDLHQRGYAVFDFPDADLNARIDRIKTRLSPRYGVDFDSPDSVKNGGERRIQDAWTLDGDVRAIASNAALLDLLSKLYGRRAFPFQTLNFPVGTEQAAHSDAVHFSSLPERFMCGVWLAMEDVGPEAGPLFYFPGSHRWPIVTNGLIGRRGQGASLSSAQEPYGPAWDALCAVHGVRPEPFIAKKGQALIWCANLLHGGSHQVDGRRTRWSQVTHYYFDDCIYYTPAFSDEALGRLQIRQPVSIHDGKRRANTYLGEAVAPSSSMRLLRRRAARTIGRIFGRRAG